MVTSFITLVTKPHGSLTLRLKIAQKPYIVWSLGPEALKYESLEPKGKVDPKPEPLKGTPL